MTSLWKRLPGHALRRKTSLPRLFFAVSLLTASGAHAAIGDVPGYTGPPPTNAFSFDLEGCRLNLLTEGTYSPTVPINLTCDSGASWPTGGDAYTDGNLGKQWNELDLVPHRFGSNSSGAVGTTVFQGVVGADNLISEVADGLAIGYDRIVGFAFNAALSTGNASQCQLQLVDPLGGKHALPYTGPDLTSTGDYGIGGAIEQIVQVVEVTQAPNVWCVWDYVQRLAITSSNIPGSSNRSFIASATGAQSVPIPSDIEPQTATKEMMAVEDSTLTWSINKLADPVTYDFGDTCDMDTPDTKDIEVTINFSKGAAVPGALTATSTVTATNPSSRVVRYVCTDKLFGVPSGEVEEELLDEQTASPVIVPPGGPLEGEFIHVEESGARGLRNELSCTLEVEDIFNPGSFIAVPGAELTDHFELADGNIAPGNVVNETVIIHDEEDITGAGFVFSTVDPTGATGAFTGYIPGTDTADMVVWDSDPQGDSGSIVFTKTITVDRFKPNLSGTLEDTASLDLTDTIDVEASASSSLTADALVNLTINKTIPDILQDAETIACNFEVKNSSDQVIANPVLNFAAGETFQTTTLTGLDADTYTVTEGLCGGLVPLISTVRTVDLTLAGASSFADCSGTADYTNVIPADQFAIARANKVTEPAGLEDGWVMTLSNGSDINIDLTTADGDPGAFEDFLDPILFTTFQLPEGSYTITETYKDGWENATSSSGNGCAFSVNYPADYGQVFDCQYTNKQKGTIITNKVTVPSGGTGFDFNGDGGIGMFSLNDGGQHIDPNMPSGQYNIGEDDPTPDYDLIDIECQDDDPGGTASDDSDVAGRNAVVNLDPGETVECTFTNRKRGMVDLLKLTNGIDDPTQSWVFRLNGPEVSNVSDSVPPTLLTFGGAKLIPGETYQLCEIGVPVAWSTNWEVEISSVFTPIPNSADGTLGTWGPPWISGVYSTNFNSEQSNEDRCVSFQVQPGETLHFRVDNVPPPGGDQRTIGYWKNWTTCDGRGRQDIKAAEHGGPAAGWYLLDDVLPQDLTDDGSFIVASCQVGVSILDKRDISTGRKRAGDAAYGLAAQLLAALANFEAGAGSCGAAATAAAAAQALLGDINFDGTGGYLKGKDAAPQRAEANSLAGTLDAYNNGNLCP